MTHYHLSVSYRNYIDLPSSPRWLQTLRLLLLIWSPLRLPTICNYCYTLIYFLSHNLFKYYHNTYIVTKVHCGKNAASAATECSFALVQLRTSSWWSGRVELATSWKFYMIRILNSSLTLLWVQNSKFSFRRCCLLSNWF